MRIFRAILTVAVGCLSGCSQRPASESKEAGGPAPKVEKERGWNPLPGMGMNRQMLPADLERLDRLIARGELDLYRSMNLHASRLSNDEIRLVATLSADARARMNAPGQVSRIPTEAELGELERAMEMLRGPHLTRDERIIELGKYFAISVGLMNLPPGVAQCGARIAALNAILNSSAKSTFEKAEAAIQFFTATSGFLYGYGVLKAGHTYANMGLINWALDRLKAGLDLTLVVPISTEAMEHLALIATAVTRSNSMSAPELGLLSLSCQVLVLSIHGFPPGSGGTQEIVEQLRNLVVRPVAAEAAAEAQLAEAARIFAHITNPSV